MLKEYKSVQEIVGPLMIVEGVEGIKYEELVEIQTQTGEKRRGRVLEIDGDRAMVQLFEGSAGINLKNTTVRFLGKPLELGVSEDMIGRVFDGLGNPIDKGPKIIPEKRVDINGSPINPVSRDYPSEFIQTGISTPRMALTCAEYLAFEKGMHVLVILTDLTNYAEALREVSAARKEVPGRRGYPGYLYTDLSQIYERAGKIKGKPGSITQIPILTMPEDDITHPIPDLTGYITEGQIILSRELYQSGIQPPIFVIPSLSRLKDKGIGKGKTREDHADTMNQIYAAYASGREARELAVILGDSALSEADKAFAKFAENFDREYVSQGYETNRNIEETLNLGWKLLKVIPRTELKRIRTEYIDKYLNDKD